VIHRCVLVLFSHQRTPDAAGAVKVRGFGKRAGRAVTRGSADLPMLMHSSPRSFTCELLHRRSTNTGIYVAVALSARRSKRMEDDEIEQRIAALSEEDRGWLIISAKPGMNTGTWGHQ
jgi:hypothetical protein